MKSDKGGMFFRTTRVAMQMHHQLAACCLCYKLRTMTCIEVHIVQRIRLVLGHFTSKFSSVLHVWLVLPYICASVEMNIQLPPYSTNIQTMVSHSPKTTGKVVFPVASIMCVLFGL
uniref:Uncharacterized protein n=1 Tax=Arundo donax TaxID=35708 RepID=A0A0A9AGJ3_ARUDO